MSRRPPRALGIAAGVVSALALVEVVWHPPARLIVYGVAVGSLYGLLAMGIVLVYRSHRIVNFAAGSMGAVPAVLALTLMTTHGLSWFLAFPLALACGALAGATTHATVVRRFADAPRLLLTVVTIGVSQLFAYIAFQLPGWLGASTLPPSIRTPFSGVYLCRADGPLGPLSRACHHLLRADDLTLDLVFALAAVAAITVGLSWFFRLTRIGIALRASADNSDRASLLGVPVHRVGMAAWAIAGALAATTIFLRAPLVGLPLGGLAGPAIILFALTAAAVARFENMGIALVAGIAMGVIDQSAVFASGRSAIATATMLPIVLVALALQRPRSGRIAEATSWQVTRIPTRIAAGLRSLPEVRGVVVGVGVVLVAGALLAPYALGDSGTSSATLIVIAAIVGVSLVVLTGWAGQISLGQYGFVGIGSLVTGHLAGNLQTDAFVTLGAGALAGSLVAVVVGWPAARLPGLLQAVTTLAFGAVVELYVLNPDFPIGRALLPQAANRIVRPALWGRIDLAGDRAFYFACLVVLAGVLASTRSLRRHRSGRVLLAVRDNAAAASAYALPAGRTRLTAFAVSGCFAGLAGVLLAYQQGAVDAATYGASESIAVFAITVVGGIGSIGGAVGAAVAFEGVKLLERSLAAFQNLSLLATGPGLVLVLLLFPDGLAGGIARLRDRWLRRLTARHGLEPPPDSTDEVAAAAPSLETAGDEVPVLAVRGLEAGYGRVQVLFGVDLEVHSGEIVALLGTNGAGKSTLLRAVSGLLHPTDGAVELDGEDVTGAEAATMASRGVAQMPGGKAVFGSLSVAEHFRVASWLVGDDPSSEVDRAVDVFPVLRERWGQPAATLSGGEQQMLGLAMALVTRPRLLLIDELSLGLDPTTVARLIEVVRDVNERGTAVLLVDQSVDLAASIADRAYFLERGQVRFAGPPTELVGRADLVRSVFLQGQAGTKRRRRRRTEERVLEVSGLRKSFGGITAVDGVDLSLPPDRIVGMIGPNGAGKTTVFDLISGYLTPDDGRIVLDGVDITGWAVHRRAAAGLGRSFQDARIFGSLTVDDNVAVGRDRHVECRDHLASAVALPAAYASEAQVSHEVDVLVDEFGLGRFRHIAAIDLSTGTRHLVDLAMALAHRPSVLLLDEPSSGIAQAEAEMLAPMLRLVQERLGCAMLIIEHDLRLLSAVADEIVALDGGRVIARDTPGRLLRNRHVVRSYTGRSKAMAGRTR